MNEVDEKIVRLLLLKGNATNTEIGKKVGLTEAAVRKRVGKLIKEGVIRKFTIELGSIGIAALVLVSTEPHTAVDKVASKIAQLPHVISTYEISGNYDVAVLLSAPAADELNRIVDQIRSIQHVSATDTRLILRRWP